MLISNILIGAVSNRVRGCNVRALFFGQDDINAIIFACLFSTQWWHLFVLYLAMKLGSATGWTEFLAGIENRYMLSKHEDLTWISKIITIKNQFTCFIWGCLRASIWVLLLQIGLYICGMYSPLLWIAIPMFYVCYKIGYKISPNRDWLQYSEPLYGAVLWGLVMI